jgi:hypothetical protein
MEIVIFVGLQASGKTTGLKYIFLTPMALPLSLQSSLLVSSGAKVLKLAVHLFLYGIA